MPHHIVFLTIATLNLTCSLRSKRLCLWLYIWKNSPETWKNNTNRKMWGKGHIFQKLYWNSCTAECGYICIPKENIHTTHAIVNWPSLTAALFFIVLRSALHRTTDIFWRVTNLFYKTDFQMFSLLRHKTITDCKFLTLKQENKVPITVIWLGFFSPPPDTV